MSITERTASGSTMDAGPMGPLHDPGQRRDLQQTCRLVLATLWLLDGVLQLQPFMFSRGSDGFSGMLRATAAGNPSWIAHAITWNASIVDHHPVLTDALFAGLQFLIGFGIAWKRTSRGALVLSMGWSIAVWWFGEGLGALFSGGDTTFGGGPGGVLFYAVLAVLLWPTPGSDEPFVAARAVGVVAAKAIWAVIWIVMAVLAVVGSGRSPVALRDLVTDIEGGEPAWLADLDHSVESLLFHYGTVISVSLATLCVAVAVSVYLPSRSARVISALAIVVFAVVGLCIQNFGGVLTGRATDPNSAPLIILLSLIYWPLVASRITSTNGASGSVVEANEAEAS
jgi:hypothetical protein